MQSILSSNQNPLVQPSAPSAVTRIYECDEPVGLSAIYESDVNMAVWRRKFDPCLMQALARLAVTPRLCPVNAIVSVNSVNVLLQSHLPEDTGKQDVIDDITYLVDLYSCLFDLSHVGMRLTRLDRQMCPRFHVDAVPCRLVTTYAGSATEWLPNQSVKRDKLGRGSNGLPDHASGIYQYPSDIQRLKTGDVALLKGEKWIGNEGAGLVHRSPDPGPAQTRIILTLDFA